MTIEITNAIHADCVLAASVVGRIKVVSCPQPADAASPVTLHEGEHSRSLGQSADYRHNLDGVAALHSAALVQTWWDQAAEGWRTTIDGIDAREEAVRRFVRDRNAERTAKATAEMRAANEAIYAAEDRERKRAVAELVEWARVAAENWAAGRVAVRVSRDQWIIVGRWDEPSIPGYGQPAEVRRAVREDDGSLALESCAESYRYVWG